MSVIMSYFLPAIGITFGVLMGFALSICVGTIGIGISAKIVEKILD